MRNQWINPNDAYRLMRMNQTSGYQTGEALRHHVDAAHGGEVSESCPACKEIQRKMKISTAKQN